MSQSFEKWLIKRWDRDQLKESKHSSDDRMYTDWTAVALLLFTAVPLLAVVAAATFFIWQKRKSPLS
ncbi:MAG: hypothetical protein CL859_07055 [Cyanobium sp. ARS6]|nr:hypothetical protein [Cyanobium sp. ARS6]